MYRLVKLFETKNGKFRMVEIRRYRFYDMAAFACRHLIAANKNDEIVIGIQSC